MSTTEELRWEELFLAQERSGQTVSAFCSGRKINYHSFKNRKTRLKMNRREPVSFVEVVAPGKTELTIRLKNGRSISVPSDFQEAAVRRLLGVLESC